MSTNEDREYEVGYGRPPKSGQFKKGKSGNPKGRPKGAKGVRASLKRELETKITVREGGRQLRISKAEAMARQFTNSALKGDMKALLVILKVDSEIFDTNGAAVGEESSPLAPGAIDYAILRDFFLSLGDKNAIDGNQEIDGGDA